MKVKSAIKTLASFPGLGVHSTAEVAYPFGQVFGKGVNLYKHGFDGVDALVIWGGADISPSLYKEPPITGSGPEDPSRRDVIEWTAVSEAIKQNILIIGVCRGAQLLCAHAGGSLIQDVSGHTNTEHFVDTYGGTLLKVSSDHHQMMYPFKVKHEMLAWCSKPLSTEYKSGVAKPTPEVEPEVVYFPEIKGLAIQCHPEWHTTSAFNEWMFNEIEKRLCKC